MEEREQKTVAQATDHPKGDKLEAEGLSGVQTFMEITEDRLVEVQIDEQHLLELIVSPYNISRAIRKVMSNGGSGGVDGMSVKDLPKYWELRGTELKELILKVNREKTEVGIVREMKFLGYSFYKTGEG